MIFTTYWFVAFALLFYPVFWGIKNSKLRLYFLLACCLIFHARFAGAAGVAPIVVLALIVYFAGILRKRWSLITGIAVCAIALLLYKYSYFLVASLVTPLFPLAGSQAKGFLTAFLPVAPPLAISFFTFEFVHYLYDVKRGSAPIYKAKDFIAFTLFFPSLVAGPIKRYQSFIPSLHEGIKNVSPEDVKLGLLRVAVGFFKKVILADNLTAAIAFYEPDFSHFSQIQRWGFVVAISLRILFDFSGYSDMAIGFARLAGIKIPENFNWPYLATSIKSFWQRWHISLSSWIRDYIYIPMGGNRYGSVRTIVHGLLAFGICGLWHGAAWNFVFWGLYHGAGLAINNSYKKINIIGPLLEKTFANLQIASWFFTMVFVGIGWVFFFYDYDRATNMIKLLFSAH
jgi:alginate O-acetyltransferase complex protein AlgI